MIYNGISYPSSSLYHSIPEAPEVHGLAQVERRHGGGGTSSDEGVGVQLETSFQSRPDDSDFVPGVEGDGSEHYMINSSKRLDFILSNGRFRNNHLKE